MYDIGFEQRLEPPPYMVPECPACGGECSTYYLNINRERIMCDSCFDETVEFDSVADAWEWNGGWP